MKHLAKTLLAAIVIAALYGYTENNPQLLEALRGIESATPDQAENRGNDHRLRQAIAKRQSDIQLRGSGRVTRLLPDDNEGSRHQKFILELNSGETILIAHNIDLAPRIDNLKRGDRVEFYGEYEWNDRGGIVHWTHKDPAGRHEDGWLKHKGKRYD
jgi:hypothetical protein